MTSPAFKFTIKSCNKQRISIKMFSKKVLKLILGSFMLHLAISLTQRVFEHLNLAQDLESSSNVQATTDDRLLHPS